jgi:hypothetical protein
MESFRGESLVGGMEERMAIWRKMNCTSELGLAGHLINSHIIT